MPVCKNLAVRVSFSRLLTTSACRRIIPTRKTCFQHMPHSFKKIHRMRSLHDKTSVMFIIESTATGFHVGNKI